MDTIGLDMDKLAERIKKHEGFRDRIYLDTEGFLTGGYGHCFSIGSRIPVDVAEVLFKLDLASAVSDYSKITPTIRKKLNTARARVIVEMIFNLGLQGTLQFKDMMAAIEAGDFDRAAEAMLSSKWAAQVKQRAVMLSDIMKKGGDSNGS